MKLLQTIEASKGGFSRIREIQVRDEVKAKAVTMSRDCNSI